MRRCAGGSLYDRDALLGISIAWGLPLGSAAGALDAPLVFLEVVDLPLVAAGAGVVDEEVGSSAFAAFAKVDLIAIAEWLSAVIKRGVVESKKRRRISSVC